MTKLFVTAAMLFAATTLASAQTYESSASQFQSRQNDEQSIGEAYPDSQSQVDPRAHAQARPAHRQPRSRNENGASFGQSQY